jgi:uncharacterized protein YjiS (DUF1127 family)
MDGKVPQEIDMTSHAIRNIEAAPLHRSAAVLYAIAQRLAAAAERLDTWLETRRRGKAARRELSAFSDRELRDIGLTRNDIETVARGNSLHRYY